MKIYNKSIIILFEEILDSKPMLSILFRYFTKSRLFCSYKTINIETKIKLHKFINQKTFSEKLNSFFRNK
jgi:hypothetical protein